MGTKENTLTVKTTIEGDIQLILNNWDVVNEENLMKLARFADSYINNKAQENAMKSAAVEPIQVIILTSDKELDDYAFFEYYYEDETRYYKGVKPKEVLEAERKEGEIIYAKYEGISWETHNLVLHNGKFHETIKKKVAGHTVDKDLPF